MAIRGNPNKKRKIMSLDLPGSQKPLQEDPKKTTSYPFDKDSLSGRADGANFPGSLKAKDGTNVSEFTIVTEYGDYLACTNGTEKIFVAKPQMLRRVTYNGKSFGGVSYAYSDANTRVASDDAAILENETQNITPSYIAGEKIHAVNMQEVIPIAGPKTFWQEIDSTRSWAVGGDAYLTVSNNLADVANAATVAINLGLEIGVDVQAWDAFLDDIAALTDPGADRLMFWDDSDGAIEFLTLGTNLSITDHTINAVGNTQEQIEDYVGAMVTGNTETLIAVTYEDSDGTLDFVVDNDLHNYDWTSVDATDLKTGSVTQAYDAGLLSLAALTYVSASFVKMTSANTFALRTLQQTSDDLEATIDHDNLLNFVANEHYLQTAIAYISTALSTGLVKVTTGTGLLSVITDSSTNWDAAYTHVSNNGTDHSYIDQSTVSGSSPAFDGTNFTGIPSAGVTDNVSASAVITDHTIVRGHGGAKVVQDSGIVIDDSDNVSSMGTLGCNEITIADGHGLNLQEDITFTGATTENQIKMPDNLADALSIQEATNKYITFITTDGEEDISIFKSVDIIHAASSTDDHSLEIDTDAAGYGDVKAIDLDYITGSLVKGEDEGIILINIDRTHVGATGGDVFGLEVLATDGSPGVYGLKIGPEIGPVHQDSGSFADPTTGTDNTPDTDVAAMIDGDTGTTTAIFTLVNEYIIIGAAAAFQDMELILTTPSSKNIKPTFWYSTAGAGQFTQFTPVDGTDGCKHSGVISWDASDLTGHVAADAPPGGTGTFDIKIIRTRATASIATPPVLGYAKVATTTEYIWDEDGDLTIKDIDISGTFTDGTVSITGGNITSVTEITATTASIGTLDNDVSPISLGDSLVPDVDNSMDLGSATNQFRNLYIDSTANIDRGQIDFLAVGSVSPNTSRFINMGYGNLLMTVTHYGIYQVIIKKRGDSDEDANLIGINNITAMEDTDEVIGHLYGARHQARLVLGEIGTVAQNRDLIGIIGFADLEAGTVHGDAMGLNFQLSQLAANTVTGDAKVCSLYFTKAGTVTGTSYMLYLEENTAPDYGIYQSGSAQNLLGGDLQVPSLSNNGSDITFAANINIGTNDIEINVGGKVILNADDVGDNYFITSGNDLQFWRQGTKIIDVTATAFAITASGIQIDHTQKIYLGGGGEISEAGAGGPLTLTSAADIVMTQPLNVGANTDITCELGTGKLGYNTSDADRFCIAHYDYMNATDFGFSQDSVGAPSLNVKTDGTIYMKENDVIRASFDMINDKFYLHDINMDVNGNYVYDATYYKGLERGSDPPEPAEGEWVIWMSDSTGKGDDGDVIIASKAGGTTTYTIVHDKSAGTGW